MHEHCPAIAAKLNVVLVAMPFDVEEKLRRFEEIASVGKLEWKAALARRVDGFSVDAGHALELVRRNCAEAHFVGLRQAHGRTARGHVHHRSQPGYLDVISM